MVTACGTAFNFDQHLDRSDGLGDTHHLTNLVDGTRLKAHIWESVGVEIVDEFHGLVKFRNTRGYDHAVDRSAAGTLRTAGSTGSGP